MSESNECRFGREIRIISNLMRRRLDSSAVMTRSKNITGTGGWLLGYLYANRDRDIYQRDVCRELDDFDEKLISVLTEDEQKTLFELLGKIKDSLEKE